MRDMKQIMEREIQQGSTPLRFDHLELDKTCYQEIASKEKLTEVLQYLHRVGKYKSCATRMVINNVYTCMRFRTPDFVRARSLFEREQIYYQMLIRAKKMQPRYDGGCYIETAKCFFSLPAEEWEKRKMQYQNQNAYGFILSDQYILGLYQYCREARKDFAMAMQEQHGKLDGYIGTGELPVLDYQLLSMQDVEVLDHCLLLDDIVRNEDTIAVRLYTIWIRRNFWTL